MKSKLFSIVAIAVFVCAMAFNGITNSNKTALSAVTLDNVEALTMGEDLLLDWCVQWGPGCPGPWGGGSWHPDQRPWWD